MWLKLIPAAQSGYPFPIVPTPAMEEEAGLPVGSCPPPSESHSPTPVPGPAHGDEWFDEDQAGSVSLSMVEDLVETSRMIQHLHERTPPPSLSPSTTAMELDE